jgi:biopolymer transport protein ExbD
MLRRRRYHASRSGQEFSSTSVFITPLLDMSFQILAFFVVTFNPPALEGRLPWEATKGDQGGPKEVVQSKPVRPDVKTELPSPIRVAAFADKQGRLERLVVRDENEDAPRPAIQGKSPEKLVADMQEVLLVLKKNYPAEKRVTVELPYLLLWDFSVLVMDGCRSYRDGKGKDIELFPRVETDIRSK